MDPASNPKNFGGVWTPWRGDAVPSHCDPNTSLPVPADIRSNFEGLHFGGAPDDAVLLTGWAWSPDAAGKGLAPLNVTYVVDGAGALEDGVGRMYLWPRGPPLPPPSSSRQWSAQHLQTRSVRRPS